MYKATQGTFFVLSLYIYIYIYTVYIKNYFIVLDFRISLIQKGVR